jgi:large subunit ribosomal protein L24e
MTYFRQGKNPRDLSWTTIYRRNHKKGIQEQFKKSKRKRAKKLLKSIVGASADYIKSQQDQTKEQRAQILKAAKKAEDERRKKVQEKKAIAAKKRDEKTKAVKNQKTTATTGQPKTAIPKHQNKNKGKVNSK